MSAVNLSAGSEAFLGVVLVLFLVITGIFLYLFARDAREQQKRDNEGIFAQTAESVYSRVI
jgi:preprotein translocase subunit YajC